jgi:hypothetical protein
VASIRAVDRRAGGRLTIAVAALLYCPATAVPVAVHSICSVRTKVVCGQLTTTL